MKHAMNVRSVLIALIGVALLAVPPAVDAKAASKKTQLVKLRLGPFKIEPQRDREVCQAIKVPNVAGLEISHWEARSRVSHGGQTASHHLVLYGYEGTDSTKFPSTLVDDPGCAAFGPPDFFKARVFLSGSGGESTNGKWSTTMAAFPGDLAQVVPSSTDDPHDAWMIINSHYFNNSKKVGHGLVKLTLALEPLDPRKRIIRQVIHVDASRGIMLPPHTKSDPANNPISSALRADGAANYSTEGGKNPSGDVCVFNLSTHMHKRGTRFLIQYAEQGQPVETVLDWPDWLHAGISLLPAFGPLSVDPSERYPALLRAYTAENGFPEIRYTCEMSNGVGDREEKMGCQQTAGIVPGTAWDGVGDGTTSHAQPCGLDGVNCDGQPCVPANLVFGPLSDDDMCILTATVYDPLPGASPDQACRFRELD